MKTLTEQYRSVKEGKGPKDVFLKEAKRQFPNLVTNKATFGEASTILKQKGIISENYVDLKPINNPIERKKEGYENAFANFLAEAEAKAEEKKVSKEVEEDAEKNYDYKDEKDPNNMIFGQIQMGYYYEMKQEKNADKTIDEIKDIVFKNLAKDPIYYTKNGQFGVDVGYTDDAPSLGEPKEPKGKYKSSGYGNLKENKLLKENTTRYKQMKNLEKKLISKGFKHDGDLPNHERSVYKKPNHVEVSLFLGVDDPNKFEILWGGYKPSMEFTEEEVEKFIDKAVGKDDTDVLKNIGKQVVNEIAIAGGLVTGGGFTSANYKDFFGLNEEEPMSSKLKKGAEELEKIGLEEMDAPMHIEKLMDAAEMAYDAGMSTDEILGMIEQHLGLKMGDF